MDLPAIATMRHGPCLHPGARASTTLRVILRLSEDDEVARAIEARERVGATTYDGAHVTLGWPAAFPAAVQEALDTLVYLAAEAGRHTDAPHIARQWAGLAREQHLLLLRMLDLHDGGNRHHDAIADAMDLSRGLAPGAA